MKTTNPFVPDKKTDYFSSEKYVKIAPSVNASSVILATRIHTSVCVVVRDTRAVFRFILLHICKYHRISTMIKTLLGFSRQSPPTDNNGRRPHPVISTESSPFLINAFYRRRILLIIIIANNRVQTILINGEFTEPSDSARAHNNLCTAARPSTTKHRWPKNVNQTDGSSRWARAIFRRNPLLTITPLSRAVQPNRRDITVIRNGKKRCIVVILHGYTESATEEELWALWVFCKYRAEKRDNDCDEHWWTRLHNPRVS